MRILATLLFLSACETDEDPKTDTEEVSEDTGEVVVEPGAVDADGDGYTDDCDDNNPDVFPGNAEVCDGLDNDCNGQIDDDPIDVSTWYADDDGDGWGSLDSATDACDAPEGHVSNSGDCDDTDVRYNPLAVEFDCEDPNDYNCDGSVGYDDADGDGYAACSDCDDADASIHPDAAEICNDIDDNCDGLTDEDDPDLADGSIFYGDSDGDGHGGQQYEAIGCDAPPGFVDNSDDCDDLEALTYPSAAEICDEEDNDCDGDIDEGVGLTWYADVDGDGYGDASSSTIACDVPQGYTANGNDCDDSSAATSPTAYEICDGVDNNCDGNVDDASALNSSTWYADTDNDGYGDATNSVSACSAPTGFVANATDCDDTSSQTNPAADETCDGSDNDCDGTTDEPNAIDASTWYADADSDTYGSAAMSQVACSAPSGHVADNTDCDDTNSATNPAATETCDSQDNDCDGTIDEDDAIDATTWYADNDNDGFGAPSANTTACSQPGGYVGTGTDCDDTNSAVNPAASELCDSLDNDCDGTTDENDAQDAVTWFADTDNDGFGTSNSGLTACVQPSGYLDSNTDCDDTDPAVNTNATESCDTVDNDCDGTIDRHAITGAYLGSVYFQDSDADGYGSPTSTLEICSATTPSGYVTNNNDCNDSTADANPAQAEVCDDNDLDEDCDGFADDLDTIAGPGNTTDYYTDADGDGYGDESASAVAYCDPPSGVSLTNDDCADDNASVNPGETEVDGDGTDSNCDLADNTCSTGVMNVVEGTNGYIEVCTTCASGEYSCQAQQVCNQVTNQTCQHQQYDCQTGSSGSWYPPSHGGSSNFNFAYTYDFGPGSDYGNICDCSRVSNQYNIADTHTYCGTGHWYRR